MKLLGLLIVFAAIALLLGICIGRAVGQACDTLDDYIHRGGDCA